MNVEAVGDAARSRRNLLVPWSTSGKAESRSYLQARLTVLFKLMFWTFVALIAFLFVLPDAPPAAEPRQEHARDDELVAKLPGARKAL